MVFGEIVKGVLASFFGLAGGVWLPVSAFIYSLCFLALITAVTAFFADKKASKQFQAGFVAVKALVYAVSLLAAHVAQWVFFPSVPIPETVAAYYAQEELVAIFANVDVVTGGKIKSTFSKLKFRNETDQNRSQHH